MQISHFDLLPCWIKLFSLSPKWAIVAHGPLILILFNFTDVCISYKYHVLVWYLHARDLYGLPMHTLGYMITGFQPGFISASYFPFGFEGRMWDLIVSVPDHCLSFYFKRIFHAGWLTNLNFSETQTFQKKHVWISLILSDKCMFLISWNMQRARHYVVWLSYCLQMKQIHTIEAMHALL